MNRIVHPYIAFSSLAIVTLIVGSIIWSSNKQLTPSTTASPSPQPSSETEWTHYVNKDMGFQMDIPTRVPSDRCKTFYPLKFLDNNGHIAMYHEYSLDGNCKKISVPSGDTSANVWVGKATNFAQAQQFYQRAISKPSCKLDKEEWIEQEKAGQSIYHVDSDGLDCSYNGVIYFKKAGIVINHDFPLKTGPVFSGEIDNKIVDSIKPIAQ